MNNFKKCITLFLMLSVLTPSFSQVLEPVRQAQDVAGDIQVATALGTKYSLELKAQMAKAIKEAKKKTEKERANIKDVLWFTQNATHVKNIIRSLNSLYCLYSEYELLLETTPGSSCYTHIKLELYGQMIVNNITAINSILDASHSHVSSIKKSLIMLNTTDRTKEMAINMNNDINTEKAKAHIAVLMREKRMMQYKNFKSAYLGSLKYIR